MNLPTQTTNLSFDLILEIVTKFYDTATFDVMIGYHFRGIDDFQSHLPRIASFWQLQLTGKIDQKNELPFDLINVHRPLKVKLGEMNRWVVLFEQNLKTFNLEKTDFDLWMSKVNLFQEKLKSGLSL